MKLNSYRYKVTIMVPSNCPVVVEPYNHGGTFSKESCNLMQRPPDSFTAISYRSPGPLDFWENHILSKPDSFTAISQSVPSTVILQWLVPNLSGSDLSVLSVDNSMVRNKTNQTNWPWINTTYHRQSSNSLYHRRSCPSWQKPVLLPLFVNTFCLSPFCHHCRRSVTNVAVLSPMSPFCHQCRRFVTNVAVLSPFLENVTVLSPMSPFCHQKRWQVTVVTKNGDTSQFFFNWSRSVDATKWFVSTGL